MRVALAPVVILAAVLVTAASTVAQAQPPLQRDTWLLSGALGWLRCALGAETDAGTHTFFAGAVEEALAGADAAPLLRLDGAYRPA